MKAGAFIKMDKELLDAIILAPFGSAQYGIVLAVFRRTVGHYKQTRAPLSLGFLAQATGTKSRSSVRRSLEELVAEGVIVRTQGLRPGQSAVLALNPDFANWGRFSPCASCAHHVDGSGAHPVRVRCTPCTRHAHTSVRTTYTKVELELLEEPSKDAGARAPEGKGGGADGGSRTTPRYW